MMFRNTKFWMATWLLCGLLPQAALAGEPRLLLSLPDALNTPDGMRLHKTTNNTISIIRK